MFRTQMKTAFCTALALCLSLCLALGAVVAPAAAQEANIKIAVVDLDTVVARSPAGQALQAKLESFRDAAKNEMEALQAEREGIQQQMTAGANTLSEDKLDELRKSFEDKTIALRRMNDDKQREGQKMQQQGLMEIEKQLEPVFEQVRDQNGYDLILNRVPGVVVMAGERVDITDEVLQMMAAGAGAGGAGSGR